MIKATNPRSKLTHFFASSFCHNPSLFQSFLQQRRSYRLQPTMDWIQRHCLSWLPQRIMTHDRWDKCLFLHWKIPPELEGILQEHTAPFALDRYEADGCAYIGLILLTEQGIQLLPGILPSWLPFSHYGVNVRTYCRGPNGETSSSSLKNNNHQNDPGIHFASLECDNSFMGLTARIIAGAPYQLANMTRSDTSSSHDTGLFLASQRILPDSRPWKWLWHITLEFTRRLFRALSFQSSSKPQLLPSKPTAFSVECRWERHSDPQNRVVEDSSFATWVVERYYCYSRNAAGLSWKGTIQHSPWPLEQVQSYHLQLHNIETYAPIQMQPIVEYISQTPPDSVLYSPGVGPIHFVPLQMV